MFKVLIIFVIGIFLNPIFSQHKNGIVSNSLDHFKINYYLEGPLDYEYEFYLKGNHEDYLLFDDKFNDSVISVSTKIYEIIDGKKRPKTLGIRFEKFNEKQQIIYRKDSDKGYYVLKRYQYNSNDELIAVDKEEYYKSSNEDEYYYDKLEIKHYRDSIVSFEWDEDMKQFKRNYKFFKKDDKIVKLINFNKIIGIYTTTSEVKYFDHGYEINETSTFFIRIIARHIKEKNTIEIVYENEIGKYYQWMFIYNSYGNVTSVKEYKWREEDVYLDKPELNREYSINYKYDSRGNWIIKTYHDIFKDITYVFERDITYK